MERALVLMKTGNRWSPTFLRDPGIEDDTRRSVGGELSTLIGGSQLWLFAFFALHGIALPASRSKHTAFGT